MRNTMTIMCKQSSFKIILILMLINNLNSFNLIKTYFAEKLCFLENPGLSNDTGFRDENNPTYILEIDYTPVNYANQDKSDLGEGLTSDRTNNTNSKDFILKDAGDIAAWLLVIIIIIPFMIVMSIFFVCCQCVFNWCKPRRHMYSDFAPPLLIRHQSYRRYDPSSNFNA